MFVIWFQGGDGFFNEILNGFLSSRYKAPYPPAPSDFHSVGNNGHPLVHDSNEIVNETSYQYEDQPLLENQQRNGSGISNIRTSLKTPLPISYAINLSGWLCGITEFIWNKGN